MYVPLCGCVYIIIGFLILFLRYLYYSMTTFKIHICPPSFVTTLQVSPKANQINYQTSNLALEELPTHCCCHFFPCCCCCLYHTISWSAMQISQMFVGIAICYVSWCCYLQVRSEGFSIFFLKLIYDVLPHP